MAENITKVTSELTKTTNLNGLIEIEVNGVNQQVMSMSCSLKENSVANITTYVTNQQLFLANSQAVATEVQKFRTQATEDGKTLNCFVF